MSLGAREAGSQREIDDEQLQRDRLRSRSLAFVELGSLVGVFEAGGPLEGFASFAHRVVDETQCTEAIDKAKSRKLIDEAGGQQDDRHVDADQSAVCVGEDGGATEGDAGA